MKIKELDTVNEKLVDSCYNNFESRYINGKNYKVMPLDEFVPKHINLKYDEHNDILILTLSDSSKYEEIPMKNISIIKDNKKLINMIFCNNISKMDQKEKRQEINECIKKITEEEKNNLFLYDLNLRLLELFKKIILNNQILRLTGLFSHSK